MPAPANPKLTAKHLRQLLRYDEETGQFYWLVAKSSRSPIGSVAGTRDKDGYIQIQIDGRIYKAHRLAYLYVKGEWPSDQIDHRDTDTSNNRWDNLRPASNAQNGCNKGAQTNNKSGFKGVYFKSDIGRWTAELKANGTRYRLGAFDTPEAASEARKIAVQRHHGQFARNA